MKMHNFDWRKNKMRRFLVTLLVISLAVVGVLICISVARTLFAANAKSIQPELDLEDAARNLENKGYTVSYIDDDDELNVNEKEYLYAEYAHNIAPDNFNDYDDYLEYIENLSPNMLKIVIFKDSKSANLYYKSLKIERDYELKSLRLALKECKHLLYEYEHDLDDEEEKYYNEYISNLNKQISEIENYVIGKKGNTVWFGTEQAIQNSNGK